MYLKFFFCCMKKKMQILHDNFDDPQWPTSEALQISQLLALIYSVLDVYVSITYAQLVLYYYVLQISKANYLNIYCSVLGNTSFSKKIHVMKSMYWMYFDFNKVHVLWQFIHKLSNLVKLWMLWTIRYCFFFSCNTLCKYILWFT